MCVELSSDHVFDKDCSLLLVLKLSSPIKPESRNIDKSAESGFKHQQSINYYV